MQSLRCFALICLVIFLTSFPVLAAGTPSGPKELAQLSDGVQPNDGFGGSVAISADGKTLVVGAPDGNSAYVYVEPASGWQDTNKYTAQLLSSPQDSGNNGISVAISEDGNTVVVGATWADLGQEFEGAAFVYVKPEGGWQTTSTPTAILSGSDESEGWELGTSVAISGGTILVGAPGANSQAGEAYVYVKPSAGWSSMTETAILTGSDVTAGANFGTAVSIQGGVAVVGAPHTPDGDVYVFVKAAKGWTSSAQTAELTASDAQSGDNLGSSVSISGSTIASGAIQLFSGPGKVYIFTEAKGGWADETQTAEISSPDPGEKGIFGAAVGLLGTTLLATAQVSTKAPQGAAFVYLEPRGGWQNTAQANAEITPTKTFNNEWFGASVSLSTHFYLVAAPNTTLANHVGFAYIYQK